MKTIYIFLIFIIVALAQLFVPTQMIFNQEDILETGTAYKFKTRPLDPSDPFRGKFIVLQYDINSFSSKDSTWQRHQDVYVYFKKDKLGFAEIHQISKTEIESHLDYVIAKVSYYDNPQDVLRFNLPFDRYYMQETKAKDAEKAHTKAMRDSLPDNTYALVFVKDGEFVLDNVFINDIPISNYVEK